MTAEALSDRLPVSGSLGSVASLFASTASGMQRAGNNSDARNQQFLPTVEGMLPSLPLAFADGAVEGRVSPGSTSLQYHDKRTIGSINLGIGYLKQENSNAGVAGKAELAVLPFNNVAVGSALTLTDSVRNDLLLNTVWQLPDSRFSIKATGGYLWGNQNFTFPSGQATIDLEQFSYVVSTQYIIPKTEAATTLHSVGFSVWGARATQLSNADGPRFFEVVSATDYTIYSDPLSLSEGRLFGASADAQIALQPNIVTKGSIGYEQLRYSFADGSSEINRSAYYNVTMLCELLAGMTVGAGYKAGAGENRIDFSAQISNWQLTMYQNNGQHGIADNRGAMLTCQLFLSDSRKLQGTLASRMQPIQSNDSSTLLAAATTRPSQLPQSFLAKVDTTAISNVLKVNKAGLSPGVSVNHEGDIFITVGTGAPTIIGITRNGAPYSDLRLVGTAGTQVILHGNKFPAALPGGDTYIISVTDGSTPTPRFYNIIITTE
ncbi:MAG: hypothetical protein WCL42_03370 [Chlorobiaceae bacterium]